MQLLFFVKTTQHEVCFERAPKLYFRNSDLIYYAVNCSFLCCYCVEIFCEGIVLKQQWLPGGWIHRLYGKLFCSIDVKQFHYIYYRTTLSNTIVKFYISNYTFLYFLRFVCVVVVVDF